MPTVDSAVKNLSTTIVFVGSFAPSTFHPSWLAHYKLIRQGEADNAQLKISHPSIAQMQVGNFAITAEENRLILGTTDQSSFVPLKDLAISIAQLLETQPVKKCGFNFNCHFSAKSEKLWHKFGHHLAPKDVWNNMLDKPGLNTMTMQGVNKYDSNGYVRVKVEPSSKMTHGVFIDVNNHFDFGADRQDAQAMIGVLKETWLKVESDTYTIINKLVEQLSKLAE